MDFEKLFADAQEKNLKIQAVTDGLAAQVVSATVNGVVASLTGLGDFIGVDTTNSTGDLTDNINQAIKQAQDAAKTAQKDAYAQFNAEMGSVAEAVV